MFFINFLAILPIDTHPITPPFPPISLPYIDWIGLISTIFLIIAWGAISFFAMRAILFGFRWRTAGSDEEYSEYSKKSFFQSAVGILFFSLLLFVVSTVKSFIILG
jgi:hypothetical protein